MLGALVVEALAAVVTGCVAAVLTQSHNDIAKNLASARSLHGQPHSRVREVCAAHGSAFVVVHGEATPANALLSAGEQPCIGTETIFVDHVRLHHGPIARFFSDTGVVFRSHVRTVPFSLVDASRPDEPVIWVRGDWSPGHSMPALAATRWRPPQPDSPESALVARDTFVDGHVQGSSITVAGVAEVRDGALVIGHATVVSHAPDHVIAGLDRQRAAWEAPARLVQGVAVVLVLHLACRASSDALRAARGWWKRATSAAVPAQAESKQAAGPPDPCPCPCIVCEERPRSLAFEPCAHVAVCERCWATLGSGLFPECPVCREGVSGTFEIFIP